MRTYSRKRPECQLIEGVENLCRLCLGKPEDGIPIFTDKTDVCATLPMRIMICVGLEMVRESCLPNQICSKCYKDLENYYSFRKKCEVTYQKLKSHVLAVKEKEFNKTAQQKIDVELVNNNENKTEKDKEVGTRHLVLMLDGENQLQVVNIVNLGEVLQIRDNSNVQKSIEVPNVSVVQKELQEEIEVQMQDVSTTNPDLSTTNTEVPTVEIETNGADISTLLSAMLFQLGILSQQEDSLIVNQNIDTIELEGGDGNCVTLELVEEDENETTESVAVQNKCINEPAEADLVNGTTNNGKILYTQDKDGRTTKDTRCGVCGKCFSTRSVLARHARVHSGERPFVCRRCGRSFAQRAVLTRHELVHAESRPFKCTQCPKSFTQRGALAAHDRSHEPPAARPLALHRCPRCPKHFLYASGLSRHMLVVHRGRQYVCGGCGRPFHDKSALLRHLKSSRHSAV